MDWDILREPNMKMCTLVVYPDPLSFSRVMPVWTWKFDTIHRALCHHNSSHMLNEMFDTTNVHIFILGSRNIINFHKHLIKHVGRVVMTKHMVNCLKKA
jgi:hypothetical protein